MIDIPGTDGLEAIAGEVMTCELPASIELSLKKAGFRHLNKIEGIKMPGHYLGVHHQIYIQEPKGKDDKGFLEILNLSGIQKRPLRESARKLFSKKTAEDEIRGVLKALEENGIVLEEMAPYTSEGISYHNTYGGELGQGMIEGKNIKRYALSMPR